MLPVLKKVVPACFALGAGMELFMIKTGFYDIVTRKEGERQAEQRADEQRMRQKMAALHVRFEEPK